ncbi:hypothetical protein [Saccharopolyspora cebuensis]|uniref:PE family protein n=1 Tax=Saccharopolyspora cebuensis TaxID=418759 RepID=A0ABV4CKX5_9PSEU
MAAAGRAVVHTVVNTGSAGGGGAGAAQASFSVDIEQIPGLIAKYEEARDLLVAIGESAVETENISRRRAGEDEVSGKVAEAMATMTSNEPGKLGWAVQQCITRIEDQISQLKAAQSGYQTADEAATPRQV